MVSRIVAIGVIFVGVSIAWMILSATVFYRTYDQDTELKKEVASLWGSEQTQKAPKAAYFVTERVMEEEGYGKNKTVRSVEKKIEKEIPLMSSDIQVGLELEHRQKGLLWYATYRVAYRGAYRFTNTLAKPVEAHLFFEFPVYNAVYDDFILGLEKGVWKIPPGKSDGEGNKMEGVVALGPGQSVILNAGYKSQGMDQWRYDFGEGISTVRDFSLVLNTDYDDINFPANTVSATEKNKTDKGWELAWRYKNLLTGSSLGMEMAQKLQPGPLAGRISLFAPVSLFFFILVLLVVGITQGISLHPMHFFFLSGAFFAFHLLVAYLADQVSIHLAFAISSLVSVFLVATYLRRVVSDSFVTRFAGPAQLVYLVAFSYAFFFKGITGLSITIGAITTLYVLMQLTAKTNWATVFTAKKE
ncbi:MAG: hypothetical protein OEW12_06210 [Deltaproteobacteria bacterium]|nr:hypothetical protein [Deltaproteobacteria bacterium]